MMPKTVSGFSKKSKEEKIDWLALSENRNPNAIKLLEQPPQDKIGSYCYLSANPISEDLLKYYIYIVVLIGCIYSKSPVDNHLMLSFSTSNIACTMLDGVGPGYHMAFSFGYAREDSKSIESGFGFQYLYIILFRSFYFIH